MAEPVSGLAAAKIAADADETTSQIAGVAGGLLLRLFGPSADVLGSHWASALESRLKNVRHVAALAADRVGPRATAIDSRVGAAVFDAAQFAENEITATYLSGVLASSHVGDLEDQGIPWVSLINRLSSDALRLHYAIFSIARQVHLTQQVIFNQLFDDAVYAPVAELIRATGWDDDSFSRRTYAAIGVLVREALIYDQFTFGDSLLFAKMYPDGRFPNPADGLIFAPTEAGVDLYLWALGAGGCTTERFGDPTLQLKGANGLVIAGDFESVAYLQHLTKDGVRVNDPYRETRAKS